MALTARNMRLSGKEIDHLAWHIRLGLDKQGFTDQEQLTIVEWLVSEIKEDLNEQSDSIPKHIYPDHPSGSMGTGVRTGRLIF